MDESSGGGRSERVLALRHARMALQVFVEWSKNLFPGLPCLGDSGFSIPGRAVGRVGVPAEEGVCREGGEPIVGDGEVGARGLALGVLHLHDVVWDAGVCRPVIGKFGEECDGVGEFEAADTSCDVGEEGEWLHHFV